VKLFVLWTALISVNMVFGRFRVDSAVKFMWKISLPLAALGVIGIMLNIA
ncbi:MAG TPA: NADH-quinone oxidoreductase subunit H, partial [Spirochaetaceae bacterium]|nr:NADH-quinone oxidoreductase subunit H [Spirochaetaceae bacterium]